MAVRSRHETGGSRTARPVLAAALVVSLALALLLLGAMVALRMLRVWSLWVYAVLGFVVWFALLESGVHATLAGVAIGLITPATALLKEDVARSYAQQALEDRQLDPEDLSRDLAERARQAEAAAAPEEQAETAS